jgi:hypothetical protein
VAAHATPDDARLRSRAARPDVGGVHPTGRRRRGSLGRSHFGRSRRHVAGDDGTHAAHRIGNAVRRRRAWRHRCLFGGASRRFP